MTRLLAAFWLLLLAFAIEPRDEAASVAAGEEEAAVHERATPDTHLDVRRATLKRSSWAAAAWARVRRSVHHTL